MEDFMSSLSGPLHLDSLYDVLGLEGVGGLGRSTIAVVAAATLVWSALRAWRRVRVKSILRGLPQPSNPSWLSGEYAITGFPSTW